ncbi:MAG: hypothetical protein UR39_C0002G0149 [Candidatus Woesebacteria bacterium GW2011_GWA1_33_30]|uniref:Uncharacterized protein n=1 Tax=Candidatus Woesebacteria bacterium GW2011_GWA2_33_28 TaxID=1618561 RepID=A0A0G0A9Q4_9BACT|nr:MAG: hypothetical protein UR38_C0002G0149 [Candidatus Woesebacteria bacterium GW2011_GWA2_33_28]KKP48859.1 MAG: hypothetical protein UR39_C0002G0149 [Candidatus Woesebacteria bacterium GW2011_GWA1_33_30]KKP50132.1 MAG: hypothetical protein UR40_C0002G0149 [Microgenomates group bacterium GW2011_GWC1_33_32]KKP51902.1 MAG: hypothetical protein UR44_C0006G0148 [Candidatus Woesebacteria bacterium GW2011_GWB1_33_38]KKP57338.1 MAG: hypothetical protein UR48_C0019G0006 [Microgenomates group bacteriu
MIVIGLLGAIALIVIAAINPIEQANRARDTRFKADAGQLISAIDRYFAANNEFPWMTETSSLTADSALTFVSAATSSIGLCLAGANCPGDGYLISTNELKTEFRNRDFIDATTAMEKIWVGKAAGASASVYACYVPLSKSERAKSENLVNLTFDSTTGAPTTCTAPTGTWTDVNSCYVCLPQ